MQTCCQTRQFDKITNDYANKQLNGEEAQANRRPMWPLHGSASQQDKARESLNGRSGAKADYAPALLELARTSAAVRAISVALVRLDKVPQQSAASAEASKLRGDLLLYTKRDMAGALAYLPGNRCRSIQPQGKGKPQSSNRCWYRARSMTPRRLCRYW